MLQLTKDVEINGERYQISKMSAMVGSWISNLLVSGVMKSLATQPVDSDPSPELDNMTPEERATAAVDTMWLNAGSILTEEQYAKVQKHCLRMCCKYEPQSNMPMPIMTVDGRWAFKDLETDVVVVNRLITEVLQFNLRPFFLASGSSAKPATAQ